MEIKTYEGFLGWHYPLTDQQKLIKGIYDFFDRTSVSDIREVLNNITDVFGYTDLTYIIGDANYVNNKEMGWGSKAMYLERLKIVGDKFVLQDGSRMIDHISGANIGQIKDIKFEIRLIYADEISREFYRDVDVLDPKKVNDKFDIIRECQEEVSDMCGIEKYGDPEFTGGTRFGQGITPAVIRMTFVI